MYSGSHQSRLQEACVVAARMLEVSHTTMLVLLTLLVLGWGQTGSTQNQG
jgi:hypothetical protein